MISWKYVMMFFGLCVGTASNGQARVEVVVTGVRDTAGTIMVALFPDQETFLKKPLTGKMTKAVQGQVHLTFDNVAPGEYAASIIHDANDNRKLDSNFIGIPKEGFGFSNDAMGTFGPPTFEKAKFKVSGPLVIRIKAKYL